MIAAADMARAAGVDPKRFRHALRAAPLSWHAPNARWLVERGGERHAELRRILAGLNPR